MFSKKLVWNILSVLVLAAGLVGCGSAPTAIATPTTIPTVDPKPTFNAVSTQAAQTVVADLTKNAPTATEVVPPTQTPVPTNTTAPTNTNTPAPTATNTRVFIAWTHTPTPTQSAYSCVVTEVSPKSGETLKVNQDFDGKWTVKNSGTKTWSAGNVDLGFISGDKFQAGSLTYDLGNDVAPNGTYTFAIDMKAPANDGTFTSVWGLNLEDGSVCQLSLNINVTK